jgi:hypothetical protein
LIELQRTVGLGGDGLLVSCDEGIVGVVPIGLGELAPIGREGLGHRVAVRGQAEQAQIVAVALDRAGARGDQGIGGLLGVAPLQEAHILCQLLQGDLVALAQLRQVLSIALLERREQRSAHGLDLGGELRRLLDERQRAQRPERLVEAADDGADVEPCRRGLHQHPRIERRIEQRELLKDALDVLAVADLEQTICHGVPIGEQGLVLRDAEIERTPDAKERAALVGAIRRAARRRHAVEGSSVRARGRRRAGRHTALDRLGMDDLRQ